jgi:hypothetical protein
MTDVLASLGRKRWPNKPPRDVRCDRCRNIAVETALSANLSEMWLCEVCVEQLADAGEVTVNLRSRKRRNRLDQHPIPLGKSA